MTYKNLRMLLMANHKQIMMMIFTANDNQIMIIFMANHDQTRMMILMENDHEIMMIMIMTAG